MIFKYSPLVTLWAALQRCPGSVTFDPTKDIPPLTGKVILVTGGNAGLGRASIIHLVRHSPSTIYLTSRTLPRAQEAIASITAEIPSASSILRPLALDLSDLSTVKAAAQEILQNSSRLDILMLNAGIMAVPPGLTAQGYEIQFGTNHLGHALLAKLLLPLLLKTADEDPQADVRVVVTSSAALGLAPSKGICLEGDSLRTTQAKDLDMSERYGQSKLANVLFASEMARRYPQLTVVSVHPGVVATGLGNAVAEQSRIAALGLRLANFVLPTAEFGCLNQVWAAAGPKNEVKSGEYYHPVGAVGYAKRAVADVQLAGRFWEWTEKELEAWS